MKNCQERRAYYMALLRDGAGFIGIRCAPELEAELKRRAARRGWSVTTYVLRALNAAFAVDRERASR